MKVIKRTIYLLAIVLFVTCSNPDHDTTNDIVTREFYQLKIYSFDSFDQMNTTETYIKKAYLPALKRLYSKPIGVFKPRPAENDSIKKIYVLIPFSSLKQFNDHEEKLNSDKEFQSEGSNYLNASYDHPPYARIESILLRAFADMPLLKPSPITSPRPDRIYELRSYESATEVIFKNKVDMFNAGGEIILFEKLKFNAVFYAEVISGPKMPNLMYMTTHADSATRETNWKNFVESPEWKKLLSMDKYKNNISHMDIRFLYPTEYSDY